jgi:two-component system, LytTR family, sensor kinase
MSKSKAAILKTHLSLLGAALFISVMVYLVFMYINVGKSVGVQSLEFYLHDGWVLIGQSIGMMYLMHYSALFFDKRHAANPNSFRRFAEEIGVVLLVGFAISELFRQMFILMVMNREIEPELLKKKLRQVQMVDLALLASLYGFMTSLRIFRYLQQKQLELLRMQKEFAQSQFEALKNQLNPHFLFNSLSTLSSLVHIDGTVAESFVVKLSKTYRYILEQKDKETVPLQQELDFLDSYLFLLEQRFGAKLQVHVDRTGMPPQSGLPPHTLMIALEHIINTNIMSSKQPLDIDLELQPHWINITYTSHPKPATNQAAEEQFTRLGEQYAFLGKGRIVADNHAEKGLIQLPLLSKAA